MMNVKHIVSIAVLALTASVWATDMAPPSWRGEPGTSYQLWSFDSDANPAAPNASVNTQAVATADVAPGDFASGWMLDGMGGAPTGYWDLGSVGTVTLDIPAPAAEYQDVWVQFTYYSDSIYQVPSVMVPGATQVGTAQDLLAEHTFPFGDWRVNQTLWRIEPNLGNSQVVLTSGPMGGVIDEIIVDTMVPEPASVLVLGIMAAGFALRRNRA